jgi:16S rRNA (guanine966-N2)-methyltransferase
VVSRRLPRRGSSPGGPNRLRIIGGRWRGRRLTFPPVTGLRPSPDRVRETLFNWLAPLIEGARCLDLFAGSGALGLEALSRGAGEATMVDAHPRAVAALGEHLQVLEGNGRVVRDDVLRFLEREPPAPFDIVFLDPPFRQGLLEPCLSVLADGWVRPGSRVYIEAEAELKTLPLPGGWEVLRSKTGGQVGYHLVAVAQP